MRCGVPAVRARRARRAVGRLPAACAASLSPEACWRTRGATRGQLHITACLLQTAALEMHRAPSRVLATTASHVVRRWRVGVCAPLPLQRAFAAVAITPVDGFSKVASSAETTKRDGSKDKSDEEWQKMVEVSILCPVSRQLPAA